MLKSVSRAIARRNLAQATRSDAVIAENVAIIRAQAVLSPKGKRQ